MIAENFKNFFTEIGLKMAHEIEASAKLLELNLRQKSRDFTTWYSLHKKVDVLQPDKVYLNKVEILQPNEVHLKKVDILQPEQVYLKKVNILQRDEVHQKLD